MRLKKRVPYICGLVGLEKKMKCKPHELSGGEQQRVGLARALVNNPKIIIADEPTGNVDPDLSFEIVDLLSEINRRGTTVLMVTHEHDLVQHFHKRVIEIHGGVVVADTNVKNQPQPYVRGASVPNTPEQEQDTFQDDDLLDDYREDDAGEQETYPDTDYQEMLKRYSVASEKESEEQTEEVKEYIASRKEWQEELASGKMFGVLIVQTDNGITNNEENQIGYLAAFSGNLAGKNLHPYFVPPVYDLLQPEGFFKIEEEQISAINIRIRELENSSSYLDSKEKWKIETEQAKAELESSQSRVKSSKGGQRNPPSVLARTFRRRTSRLDSGKSISKS